MAFKFQYNKTALHDLRRQLIVREKALPILKNKETALRQEVKNARKIISQLKEERETSRTFLETRYDLFWPDLPDIVRVKEARVIEKNVVGIRVPEIEAIEFDLADINYFMQPAWVPAGIAMLQRIIKLEIRFMIAETQLDILYKARKKTTQKVNLYEKVQIPAYESAILKIKRFLEDKENISKAAQKIVKKRNETKVAA